MLRSLFEIGKKYRERICPLKFLSAQLNWTWPIMVHKQMLKWPSEASVSSKNLLLKNFNHSYRRVIWSGLLTSVQQWAAVRTWLLLMIVPAHSLLPNFMCVIQGHEFFTTVSPPIIFESVAFINEFPKHRAFSAISWSGSGRGVVVGSGVVVLP